MHAKAERIQEELRRRGAAGQVRELPGSTRTSAEAAAAIGTSVAQIAKSLVFLAGDQLVLVIASGAGRVDTGKLGKQVGADVRPSDAKTVKERTGFSVGGVPPLGHSTPLRTYIDQDLMGYDEIWAAAGTPHAVFPTTPDELVRLSGGEVADVRTE
ncbi:MAG: YbaK/EbsC family protein [Streptosporangiaceae bacterium]